jgi:hypothetical protein
MGRHFDLTISYEKKSLEVTVQCLSEEFPLIYAVWPKDETLKLSFDNSFVLFTQYLVKRNREFPTTWRKVHYSKDTKSPNLKFELAVWNVLSELENFENS